MNKYIFFLLISFPLYAPLANALRVAEISLEQCQKDAVSNSAQIKQKEKEASAALAQYKSARASLYPSLSITGKGGWVSKIPELELGRIKTELGDNWSYSAGPELKYVLFDSGARNDVLKSEYEIYQAKEQELNFAKKNIILQARLSYFAVQQDLERIFFIDGQLKVAQKQLDDALAAFKTGTKNRLDVNMAVKQKLRAQINISNARTTLSIHLRELFAYTGIDYGIDAGYPTDWRIEISRNDKETTSIIKTDALEDSVKKFKRFKDFLFDENSPSLASLDNIMHYYQFLAGSYQANLYPSAALSGGAYWEYPNTLIREHVFLGRAGVAFKIPLFEGSKNKNQAKAIRLQAEAAGFQKIDTAENLKRLFYSSKSVLRALSLEETMIKDMIENTKETAALTYEAYNAGAVTFLEVDNANLNLLESNIALADIYVRQLNRLALIDNLGRENL
ncbi:MAG: TolC family protein [Elusimicrobiota bacterium]|nr:TolC family protein [Elusimicrobiota bacterium]